MNLLVFSCCLGAEIGDLVTNSEIYSLTITKKIPTKQTIKQVEEMVSILEKHQSD